MPLVTSSNPADWITVHDFFANVQLFGTPELDTSNVAGGAASYDPVIPPAPHLLPSRATGVEQLNDSLLTDYLAALARFPPEILQARLPRRIRDQLEGASEDFAGFVLEGHVKHIQHARFKFKTELAVHSQIVGAVLTRFDGGREQACLSIEIKTSRVFEDYLPSLVKAGFSSGGLPLSAEGSEMEGIALKVPQHSRYNFAYGTLTNLCFISRWPCQLSSNSLTGLGIWTDAVDFVVTHQFTAPDQQPQLVFGRPSSLQCSPLSIYQIIFYAMITSSTPADHSYPRPVSDPTSFIRGSEFFNPDESGGGGRGIAGSGRGSKAEGAVDAGEEAGASDQAGGIAAASSLGKDGELSCATVAVAGVGQPTPGGWAASEKKAIDLAKCKELELFFDFPLCAKTALVLHRLSVSLSTSSAHACPSQRFDVRLSPTDISSSPVASIQFDEVPFSGAAGTAYRGNVSGQSVVIKLARSNRDELKQEGWIYQAFISTLTCVPVCYGFFGDRHRLGLLLEDRGKALRDFADLDLTEQRSLLDSLREVHRAGIFHRDMRPPNVTRSEAGRISIIDFSHASVNHECREGDCEELNKLRRELGVPDEESRSRGGV